MKLTRYAVLSALVAGSTLANGAPQQGSDNITDILVTAPEPGSLPGSQLLEKNDFYWQRATTSDSAALLRNIPGVSLYGAGGLSSLPAIRGLGDDRLRIKVDGMDLVSACGNHMNPPLSYIDPTHIDSIEVYAGVSPVSLGGDNIGGSIVVNSAEPEFASSAGTIISDGEAGAFYRSNGNGNGANLSLAVANHLLSLRYSGAYGKSDNYSAARAFKAAEPAALGRDWLEGDEVGSSAYESHNHRLGLALQKDNHFFDLELGYQHIPYQGFPNQRMDMTDNTSTQVAVKHRGDYDWGKVESRIYYERTRHSMNFGDDKQFWYGDAPGMPMETEGENSGVNLHLDYNLSDRDLLKIGGEVQLYRLDDWWPPAGSGMMMAPNTFANISDGERDRYALFGELQSQWDSQWLTIAGVRYEQVKMDSGDVQGYSMMYNADALAFNRREHSRSDDNWDFSALVRFTPSATQSYDLGLARKTRSPNLYERYTWSTLGMAMRMINLAGDGNGYVGNLDLDTEVAHTLSLTADWHDSGRQHWQLVITPFISDVDDYIDATPCTAMACVTANAAPGFRYLTFANNDARLYGVDISGFRHLAVIDGLGSFSVRALVNYVDGENRTTGDNLYNIMPLNATLTLEHSSGNWTNTADIQWVSAKDDTAAVRNEVATSGYALVNLRSSFTWQQVRVDMGIENSLDRQYNLPLGGAYVGQGKTMAATDVPWGTAVPGMGRSVYVGVNYRF